MDYKKILSKIKPSEKETKKVHEFSEKLVVVAKKVSSLDAVICGSLGKGTWLSGNHDIDIFILFPKETKREVLEKKGLEFGARICKELNGKAQVRYAEHPYTNCSISGFTVDIVPCYRIHPGERIISAVDRSPLHLEFVKENLKDEMKDNVLLLKQFCKSAGMYGSDAKTLGFSGYVCELLVLKYGSFEKAVKAASDWHLPYVIDLAGKSASYHKEIFVVIDPTDIHRNAAAIVSPYNIVKFMQRARQFVAKPSADYFMLPELVPLSNAQIAAMKKRETHFLCVSMKRPDVIDDILYQQARKALARLCGLLKHNEFVPLRAYEFLGRNEIPSRSQRMKSSADIGKNILLFFELEVGCLPEAKKMVGPPLFARKHVEEFTRKYRNAAYIEGNNVVADKKREHKTPSSLVKDIMAKGEKELADMGIPGNIIAPLKSAKIYEGNGFFPLLREREFSDFLRRMYFESIT